MKTRRRSAIFGGVAAIFAVSSIVWLVFGGAIEQDPGSADPAARSKDLAGDTKLMWETHALKGNAGPQAGSNPQASTDRAINAASRVFNSVPLIGKTREEVIQSLGDPQRSNRSIYNFPFWPAPPGALVYRFDGGAYGWQFNVVFGADETVTSVARRWIH